MYIYTAYIHTLAAKAKPVWIGVIIGSRLYMYKYIMQTVTCMYVYYSTLSIETSVRQQVCS